jgi:hypothetical protein
VIASQLCSLLDSQRQFGPDGSPPRSEYMNKGEQLVVVAYFWYRKLSDKPSDGAERRKQANQRDPRVLPPYPKEGTP